MLEQSCLQEHHTHVTPWLVNIKEDSQMRLIRPCYFSPIQFPADLVIFTEKSLTENFLCSVIRDIWQVFLELPYLFFTDVIISSTSIYST